MQKIGRFHAFMFGMLFVVVFITLFSLAITLTAHAASATIGQGLYENGYRRTTCVGAATASGPRFHRYGTFDPTKTDYTGRYGFNYPDPTICAGNFVGERLNPDEVFGVVRHPSNPLSIISNTSYPSAPGGQCGSTGNCLNQQDASDVELVADNSGQNVHDSFFLPTYSRLFPTPTPSVSPLASPGPSPTAKPSPSPSPVAPSPTAKPSPTQPPGVTCAPLPPDVDDTANLAPGWKTVGPARQGRLQKLKIWVSSCR